ncbi:hypothetical protein K437DRAFT_272747 [Tilletiaria anomala UBC 951]|uniref:Voltage-dependent ion-selective channel n=1 Tax=Tilletiaria anomala (strain ATCC 24038 / CBS 436.72 / UBC 951) TaxID=1037660 RepID=A0A066WDM1_TILAU|nr:uncharacterized protein K437DRAFT_272747 [Tilletiaria anomala UBC 951]KDN52047.1 hypothetical protein K437DRAFT_272747 [Tilletiaria anomala UBC 951]
MAAPIPPSWKDLGKAANDLLTKDYPIQGSTLEVKTKAPNGVTFRVLGLRDNANGSIGGDLEVKYDDKKRGTAVTTAWTTSNILRNHVELDNHLAKGLKFEAVSTLQPEKSAKTLVLASLYKQPGVHTRNYIDVFKGPLVTADAVVGKDGFLVGGEAAYSVKDASVTRYNLAAGFHAPEYAVTLQALGNLKAFVASYYHRVNNDIETSARATYDKAKSDANVKLEVGTKAYLDNAAFVKAKINNDGILCLGYTQALRPGVKASLGLALDTKKLQGNDAAAPGGAAHKVGASLVFES